MATKQTEQEENAAFAAALDELIPKTLDAVIRLHRDEAELRIASDADLKQWRARVPNDGTAQDVSSWTLVTFDWHRPGSAPVVDTILVGNHVEEGPGWRTSPVRQFDKRTKCLRTHSGTLYHLKGPGSNEPDLFRLCAWLHRVGLGAYLGVMHIFY